MQFGAAMFFTDYSMSPAELGRALEERGFESVWAPEHSHIPLSRRTPFPGGGDLPKRYYDAMDPFVTLTAAAAAGRALRGSAPRRHDDVVRLQLGPARDMGRRPARHPPRPSGRIQRQASLWDPYPRTNHRDVQG